VFIGFVFLGLNAEIVYRVYPAYKGVGFNRTL
jgi:hypothetical protein